MGTRFYLHVGPSKTGTSHLQSFFARNVQALRKNDISYPENDVTRQQAQGVVASGNGFELFSALREGASVDALFDRYIEQAAGLDTLISAEQLSGMDPDFITRLIGIVDKRGLSPRVVYYFRPPIDAILAAVSQWVKRHGFKEHPRDVLRANIGRLRETVTRSDIRRVLQSWEARVGRANIMVRLYDRERFSGGRIETDFLAAIGIEKTAPFNMETTDTNPTLGEVETALMLALNARYPNPDVTTQMSSAMLAARQRPAAPVDPKVKIPRTLADQAAVEFAEDLVHISRHYGLPHLSAYTEEIIGTPETFTTDQCLEIAAVTMRELVGKR